jgi:hypothetical protein
VKEKNLAEQEGNTTQNLNLDRTRSPQYQLQPGDLLKDRYQIQ